MSKIETSKRIGFTSKSEGLFNFQDYKKAKYKMVYVIMFLFLLTLSLICLLPVLWVMLSGFKSMEEMYAISLPLKVQAARAAAPFQAFFAGSIKTIPSGSCSILKFPTAYPYPESPDFAQTAPEKSTRRRFPPEIPPEEAPPPISFPAARTVSKKTSHSPFLYF